MNKRLLLLLFSLLFQARATVLPAAPKDSGIEGEIIGQRIAERASMYMKAHYKFGGHTSDAVDCSGLVYRIWADLKLGKLPPQASALYKLGRAVQPEELRAGDLIFFENTYRRGISHVGIYTEDAEFIHAANKRVGVTVGKVTDPYYLKRIVGARRLY